MGKNIFDLSTKDRQAIEELEALITNVANERRKITSALKQCDTLINNMLGTYKLIIEKKRSNGN